VFGAFLLTAGNWIIDPLLAGERAVAAEVGAGDTLQGAPALSLSPSEAATRMTVHWYIAATRTCVRGYKKPTVCTELTPAITRYTVRYAPANPARSVYFFGFTTGSYVKAFTRDTTHGWWYAGDAMPGVAGMPLGIVMYPRAGEGIMLTAFTQPKCEGCQ
jgi:hypothetical protein